MLSEYLDQEWSKIKSTNKVISIKNISRKYSLLSDNSLELVTWYVRSYFKELENALFINDNLIIDKMTIIRRNINSIESLEQILRNEYFIFNFDIRLVWKQLKNIQVIPQTSEKEKEVEIKIDEKKIIRKVKTKEEKEEKRYLDYPEELFDMFYEATHRWQQSLEDSQTKQGLMILNYLKLVGKPLNIFDIYANLAGSLMSMSIRDLQKLLGQYQNFIHVCNGYWTARDDDIAIQIGISQWIYGYLSRKSLEQLVEAYIDNKQDGRRRLCIDQMIESFEISSFSIERSQLEDYLIEKAYTEVYPGCWMRFDNEPNLGRFQLKSLWDKTSSNVFNSTKNTRDVNVFNSRVFEGKTLEEIGKSLNITRERVRQIEKKMRRKIQEKENSPYITPFMNWLFNILAREKIVDLISIGIPQEDLETFDTLMSVYFKTDEIYKISDNIVMLKSEYDRLLRELCHHSKYSNFIKLREMAFYPGFSKKFELYEKFFMNSIGMIKLNENEFYYSRGRLNKEEEISLVIYQTGRPLHYTEVPKAAQRLGKNLSADPGRNVLAIMQRNNLLKRVAPGTYGLKEWDIPKHIYITDLIYKVLEDADRPLFYDELLSEVRRQRFDDIKEHSVEYYLSIHEDVKQIYTKQYILTEWLENPEKLITYGIDLESIEKSLTYSNKVIMEIMENGQGYITKYRMSDASRKSSLLRISRNIKFSFNRRVVVIDKNEEMHFQSYSSDCITGISRWTYIPDIDEIFYLEFINERIIRYLSHEMFLDYKSMEEAQLEKAEAFWSSNMEVLADNETVDEDQIDSLTTKESLIDFGLKKGYVYYKNIENLVEKGYKPMELLYELNDRGIIVNY